MLIHAGRCRLELVQGDITQQHIDMIVNAANVALNGGSGVDGAIHAAAGPEVMADLRRRYPEGCPAGSAVASVPGRLAAKHLLHAVGPIWRGGHEGEPALLASAYRTCLKLAGQLGCSSIAFPAISTGAYGYPLDLAANNAIKTTLDYLRWHKAPALVRFVLFDAAALAAHIRAGEEQVPQ